jgi:hypothetical protein
MSASSARKVTIPRKFGRKCSDFDDLERLDPLITEAYSQKGKRKKRYACLSKLDEAVLFRLEEEVVWLLDVGYPLEGIREEVTRLRPDEDGLENLIERCNGN